MSYLLSHWRGKLPLGLSLWANMLGLLVVLSYAELFALSQLTSHPSRLMSLTLVSLFISRLLIFPWQLIGLLRSIDYDYIEHKNGIKTRFLQAIAVLTVLFTLVYALEVIQGAAYFKSQVERYSRPEATVDYKLLVDENQQLLEIHGGLDIGITNAVRSLLGAQPQINSVVLESRGGQIYEGRGLAKVFTEFGLDTYVQTECSSACVTAFIGGKQRYLGAEGKLGFHQYWVETSKTSRFVPFYNLAIEQERDLALFKSRGIGQFFLDRMFDQPAHRIWFPDQKTLLDARVVHFVIPLEE